MKEKKEFTEFIFLNKVVVIENLNNKILKKIIYDVKDSDNIYYHYGDHSDHWDNF